ncbi:MAG: hypothetical protein EA425_09905, partial [Puniceicoccaceae bacterium]
SDPDSVTVIGMNLDGPASAVYDVRVARLTIPVAGSVLQPPGAPTGLAATAVSHEEVSLSWMAADALADGFRIERATGGGTFSLLTEVGPGATSHADTTVSPETQYSYRVRAFNAAGDSPWSATDSATTPAAPQPPAAPSGLVALPLSTSEIHLDWLDNATDADGFTVQRDGGAGFDTIATVTSPQTDYTDDGLPPDTGFNYRVRAFNAVGDSAWSNTASAATFAEEEEWTAQDIGSVGVAGSSSYDPMTDSFTVSGSGADIWGTADGFRFVWLELSGNVSVRARVMSQQNTHVWAKAGVMIRNSLTANSAHAMTVITPSHGVAFQRRTAAGNSSLHTSGGSGSTPIWVRIDRVGNSFTSYRSADGVNWTQIGSPVTISMSNPVFVGLAVTSHNNSVLSQAVFEEVSVITD